MRGYTRRTVLVQRSFLGQPKFNQISTRLFQKEGCAITTIIPAGSLTQSELSLLLSSPPPKKRYR